MAKPRKKTAPTWYTLVEDRGTALPSQFQIRQLDGVEMQSVCWSKNARGEWDLDADSCRHALLCGLLGWRDFRDEEGEIAFNRQEPEKNLEYLTTQQVAELAVEIVVSSTLTEEQRKNLLSQRMSGTTEKNSTAPGASGAATATSPTERP